MNRRSTPASGVGAGRVWATHVWGRTVAPPRRAGWGRGVRGEAILATNRRSTPPSGVGAGSWGNTLLGTNRRSTPASEVGRSLWTPADQARPRSRSLRRGGLRLRSVPLRSDYARRPPRTAPLSTIQPARSLPLNSGTKPASPYGGTGMAGKRFKGGIAIVTRYWTPLSGLEAKSVWGLLIRRTIFS